MNILVGYTGFVGSNLASSFKFDGLYNSKNIELAYGTNPDLLIYSGVRAEKFYANNNPLEDLEIINQAINNIKKINSKKLVLISTVDVYLNASNVDEDTDVDRELLEPYGANRYELEKWVEENYEDYLIVRLPALYGENIKKNFIFDMISLSPALLTVDKYEVLCREDDFIKDYYVRQDDRFYKCIDCKVCREYFNRIGFSALNFTDSRSVYQFYPLKYLWKHINYAMEMGIQKLNLATQPVSANEVYEYINNKEFVNEIAREPFNYNMRTKYYEGGYIFNKEFILEDLKKFVLSQRNK